MKLATEARFSRLLAIVPWVHDQGGATVTDVCSRFGVEPGELVRDLDLLACSGVAPFSPDVLPQIFVDLDEGEGWVSASYPLWFGDRIPLTPTEGFLLLTNAQTMLSVPGVGSHGPLARALAKLAAVVGVGVEGLDLSLGERDPDVVAALREAVESYRGIEIDYFSMSSGRRSTRRVDPHHLFHDGSDWYVTGICHLHGEQRTFNVGRIHAVRVLDETFTRPGRIPEATAFARHGDEPVIALDLAPEGAWVIDTYPTESVERLDDGTIRVEMAVANPRLIARLLIRLGPAVTVVSAPSGLMGEARALARNILDAYA